jgi:hypothetical protein
MINNEWVWGIAGTVIGSLIVSAIAGTIAYFRHKWLDTVRLECKLKSNTASAVLDKTGSPCMELMIKSVGLRSARIKGAMLCLEDKKDFISRFKQGFDGLECTPIEGEPQTIIFKFYGSSKPNSTDGYILDRDDICRFLLPVCVPCIQLFAEAQSEKVTVRIIYFDDKEETVLKGLIIQNELRSILIMAEHSKEPFKAKFADINIRVKSYSPPDLSFRGSINTREVRLDKLE